MIIKRGIATLNGTVQTSVTRELDLDTSLRSDAPGEFTINVSSFMPVGQIRNYLTINNAFERLVVNVEPGSMTPTLAQALVTDLLTLPWQRVEIQFPTQMEDATIEPFLAYFARSSTSDATATLNFGEYTRLWNGPNGKLTLDPDSQPLSDLHRRLLDTAQAAGLPMEIWLFNDNALTADVSAHLGPSWTLHPDENNDGLYFIRPATTPNLP